MSRYGFDIDGTLTIPRIRDLANDLHAAGHEIHIVTGGLKTATAQSDNLPRRLKHREEQLRKLGVNYTKLSVCVGITTQEVALKKAKICQENEVSIIFEDTQLYLDAIKEHSCTLGLLIQE